MARVIENEKRRDGINPKYGDLFRWTRENAKGYGICTLTRAGAVELSTGYAWSFSKPIETLREHIVAGVAELVEPGFSITLIQE